MKKLSAVLLSILMVLTCLVPMASAYDKQAVVGGDYSALTDDDVLGIVLDWLDAKIAAVTADFESFEVEVMGQQIAVDIPEITGIDSLIEYKDHLADLEGDFANLDTANLIGRAASGSDTQFVKNLVQFMADNADTFGKVFRWDDEVFDYGKVGEYIEANFAEGDPIRDFYDDYLIGNNIQEKFVSEIAREMGYEIPDGEIFDDTLNNGIKAALAPVLKDLLKTEASKTAYDAFNLKTTDVYALVKAYVGLLQNDYKDQFDDLLEGFLKALQGMVKVVTAGVNIDPPALTVGHENNPVYATYHPSSPNAEDYMPTIYANDQAKDMLDQYADEEIGVEVKKNSEMSAEDQALVGGVGEAWGKHFIAKAAMGDTQLLDLDIKLDDVENAVKNELVTRINGKGANFSAGNVSVAFSISDADATFSYKAYQDTDSFAVQAKVESATAKVNITAPITATADVDLLNPDATVVDWGSAASMINLAKSFGIDADQMVIDTIKTALGNPSMLEDPAFVTIVMNGLDGVIEELEQVKKLVGYIDTEAEYDDTLLDVSANYDAYKGVVGQANHILYGLVDMIASDAGMADLALTDGDNGNLYSNLQKICDKVSGLFEMMKQYIDRDTFVALAETAGISDVFASAHGFNAGMVYDMDFSSVENALDCGIRIACDLLAEDDEESIFYDFHMRVEDLDTLDAIIASAMDMILSKLLAKVDIDGWDYTYTAIDAAAVDAGTISAQDAVMDKVVDILYEAADFAVPKINAAINKVIAALNEDFDLQIGDANFKLAVSKGANWEATLGALADRFLDLTDGLILYPVAPAASDSALLKVSKIADAVLPMNSMFSNYTGLVDMNEALFTKAADGDFGDLLAYFEVKEDAIAGGVPVTKALINASDYIVDAFFPDTVQTELYPASETVQQTFTGAESDQGIAARNMVSINNRKADLIPVACRLLKESDILKTLACAHANVAVSPAVEGSCTTPAKSEGKVCEDCGLVIEKAAEGEKDPTNHTGGTEVRGKVDATCAHGGYTGDTWCLGCNTKIADGSATPKSTTHSGGTEVRGAVTANCHAQGYSGDTYCKGCGEKIATGSATPINANNHQGGTEVRGAKEATTEEEGYTGDTYCKGCGTKIATGSVIGKKSENFFQRIIRTIRGFFDRILNFFRNLF